MTFAWLKGHGTENDFVLLPDHDGSVHGDLAPEFVSALCERRSGIGADGVLRVIRTSALRDGSEATGESSEAEWFMDYRNADGSLSEMCGNGIRVFAMHLVREGLVDGSGPFLIGTRDGDKQVTVGSSVGERDQVVVDMGVAQLGTTSKVTAEGRTWEAHEVNTGNPHAVAFVDRLDHAGSLLTEPEYDHTVYPDGVNIEFVVHRAPQHVAMRVHERGSGETRSCGTGACAVAVASAVVDHTERPVSYRVDVPGGTVFVTWTADDHLLLEGPAAIVARGEMEWLG